MDGFSGYNQIAIKPKDQHKTTFVCPWGIFAYQNLPFSLKNVGATFQRAMDYTFHDIRHIVQAYMDDLPSHSKQRTQHLNHLRAIFLRCRFYNIHLNPHKFFLCRVWMLTWIHFLQTTVISLENPMRHIFSRQVIGGKYSNWIVILQKFDLVFTASKAKNSLVFAELLSNLPIVDSNETAHDPLLDEAVYLIDTTNPWYSDILVYLQAQRFCPELSAGDRYCIHHQAQHYLGINDTLYRHSVDTVLRCCLTHEEAKHVLNDYHAGACGGHISSISTAQKILCVGYYWPTLFKDYVQAIRQCHPCQVFTKKMCAPLALLHLVISIDPFAKWGIDFVTCNPVSSAGHNHIIVVVDYFTKWAEALPTYRADGETVALFLCN
eukprot:PITA_11916